MNTKNYNWIYICIYVQITYVYSPELVYIYIYTKDRVLLVVEIMVSFTLWLLIHSLAEFVRDIKFYVHF